MFRQISSNDDKVKRKKRNEFSVVNQANQLDYGIPEWQQDWNTTKKIEQTFENVLKYLILIKNKLYFQKKNFKISYTLKYKK